MARANDLESRPDIAIVLSRVESDKVELRSSGITELRRIITENRLNSKLKQIDDKGYHAILETVFRVVKVDSSNFARASKHTSSKIASRITACASVVRTIVDVGLLKLRYRSVKALIDHISQSLPTADGDYCEPLLNDYFKALSGLLGYHAHIEHMNIEDWHELLDFCLDVTRDLTRVTPFADQDAPATTDTGASYNRPSASASLSTERSSWQHNVNPHALAYPKLQNSNEDILFCLKQMTCSSRAPVMDKAQPILEAVLSLLQRYPHLAKIQQTCYETIEAVLSHTVVNDMSLSLQSIRSLIPLVQKTWQRASFAQRESILAVVFQAQMFFPLLMDTPQSDDDDHFDDRTGLKALLETMKAQYCGRKPREQLLLEDIEFSEIETSVTVLAPLSLKAASIRLGALKAEEPWAVIKASAAMYVALERKTKQTSCEGDQFRPTKKRRKISQPLEELLHCLQSPHQSTKVYALQVIAFVLDIYPPGASLSTSFLECLMSQLSSDDVSVVAWATFAIMSQAGQSNADSAHLSELWPQVWKILFRHIASPGTCRVACQALTIILENKLVAYSTIDQDVEGMLSSISLNGPAKCDGAATRFWSTLLFLRQRQGLRVDTGLSKAVLVWLDLRWSPARINDRVHYSYLAHHFSIAGVLRLVCICLGHTPPHPSGLSPTCLGRLSQSLLRTEQASRLVSYLLQEAELPFNQMSNTFQSTLPENLESNRDNSVRASHDNLFESFIHFLSKECSMAWDAYSEESSLLTKTASPDTVSVLLQMCIVGYGLVSEKNVLHRYGSFVKTLDRIRDGLRNSLMLHERRRDYRNSFFDCVGAVISHAKSGSVIANPIARGIVSVSKALDRTFWDSPESELPKTNGHHEETDFMELDDNFSSQTSQRATQNTNIPAFVHSKAEATTSVDAFRAYIGAKLFWASKVSTFNADESAPDDFASASIVEYLTSLRRREFVLCGTVLEELFQQDAAISEDDADTLLQYLQQMVMKPYEMEKSEVSVGLCIHTFAALVPLWTASAGGDLTATSAEIYMWFLSILKDVGNLPANVLVGAARLLRQIVNYCPEYGKDFIDGAESARSHLLKILETSSLTVKDEISNDISNIFRGFVLGTHDEILKDVIVRLPEDPTWPEGIALRLNILGKFARAWPTLLRRSLYHIFETAGMVPSSARYATVVLDDVSKSVNLSSAKDLFKLFAPQLIYSWTDPGEEGAKQSLGSIPFSIFGYTSLKDLLFEVQDEAVGQATMRGQEQETSYLSSKLSLSTEELLTTSFDKAAAYSIARDIALPPAETSGIQAEARLRKILGKDRYKVLAAKHFADIVALFFLRTEREDTIEKAFQRGSEYAKAETAYHQITSISQSSEKSPTSQQPSFSSKYLLAQIDHMCNRTSVDVETMWIPPLYVYVFRKLVTSIHPTLGSQYASAALRRLRILISMVGSIAFEGYPLEMALHAIRPFLTDAQCADDALGLVQYLLENGVTYLCQVPPFFLGFTVSTLLAIKDFLISTQDSTTQESQFKATLATGQRFREWLITYLKSFRSKDMAGESYESFKKFVSAIGGVQHSASARQGTPEGDLLLAFLDDQRSGRNLLPRACHDSITTFLETSFDKPTNFREDILGEDKCASSFASTIWNTCRQERAHSAYRLWSCRVLGRSFASQGFIDKPMLREVDDTLWQEKPSSDTNINGSNSRAHLLQLMSQLLQKDDRLEIDLAEMALSYVVTESHGTSFGSEYQKSLDPSLYRTLWCTKYETASVALLRRYHPYLQSSDELPLPDADSDASKWIQTLAAVLTQANLDDPLLKACSFILGRVKGLAEKALPFILHLNLLAEHGGREIAKGMFSNLFKQLFISAAAGKANVNAIRVLLNAILYLRTQPLPHETVRADRLRWLEIDFSQASVAAKQCSMYKTALMFLEFDVSEKARLEASSRRRSKVSQEVLKIPADLLLDIYEHLDERDAFYGIKQSSGLLSVMSQLEYEEAGFKSLSFRGAFYDCQIRQSDNTSNVDLESMVRVLNNMDLNGLSQPLVNKVIEGGTGSMEAALSTARKLEQWDIVPPKSYLSHSGTVFEVFRKLNTAVDLEGITEALDHGFTKAISRICDGTIAGTSTRSIMCALAILTEVEEVFSAQGSEHLQEVIARFRSRDQALRLQSYDHIKDILSCRETTFSSLSKRQSLQGLLKVPLRDSQLMESHVLLASAALSRQHGALQNALTTVTYLNQLVEPCARVGVNINAVSQVESAHVLWSQGEKGASVRLLKDLMQDLDKDTQQSQSISVGKPEVLAKLGHHTAEARLEKPDFILQNILKIAVKELKGAKTGSEAGDVYHEFASFCDHQLQNPDSLADFERIKKLRKQKEAEVQDLDRMIKSVGSQAKERDNLKSHRNKAQQWFNLDDGEYRRLELSRQTLLRHSLENYLLGLQASDEHDNDALRFSALWLENTVNNVANEAVTKYISMVPSRKFASLMNQWTSRLLAEESDFQSLLYETILRICVDHPYHGMYQIFASSKTRGGKDDIAMARHQAANNVADRLKRDARADRTWLSLHNMNVTFVRFAQDRMEGAKPGTKVLLRKSQTGQRVEQDVQKTRIPPPTMNIELRADSDYSRTTMIAKFQPEFSLASGISMPKIVTAIGTNGKKYKQLFKSGHDDLRQDAIMEQVFGAVSSLLGTQQATRQRDLKIRAYKVLPLTATAGVIEFVSNTVPLHDYLLPAHQRHFPKDLKPNACRKYIQDAQDTNIENRARVFRKVCDQFHPVLRYFFQERFESPDDWFEKRLAYTRSTAAISILGHILGLGDRHGHNILLDEKTGEVVHIDLGIAFEQGRILPVPEVVPFRLTRDLVDGMGITGTEGVFRRCCEFTLEALRNESYAIMTILDVLRYDPLYSWSLSPLRLKRMQEAQTENPALPPDGSGKAGKSLDEEAGEAERALLVVSKKLSPTLSVQAVVNELIQQATDERNLAVLFCGWAAYA